MTSQAIIVRLGGAIAAGAATMGLIAASAAGWVAMAVMH